MNAGLKKRKHRALSAIPGAVKKKIEEIPDNFDKPFYWSTLIDVVLCRLIYGSGVDDYFDFRFYSLNHIGRKSFGTIRDMFKLYRHANNSDFIIRTANKNEFVKYYSQFMGRETMCLDAETDIVTFTAFLERAKNKGFKRVIFKPYRGNSGRGVFILSLDDPILKNISDIFIKYQKILERSLTDVTKKVKEDFQAQKELIVEWVLENHETLKKIHPSSLNTLRIPTLRQGESCKITGAFIRFGRDGKPVDNISSGGMVAEIDLDSGIVISPAVDHKSKEYYKHPTTNEIIIGLQIPYWEEVKTLALKAAEVTPELRYTSWDLAVTPNGPVVIEGNSLGGLEIQQMPRHIGKRYLYENVLNEK